MQNTKSKKYCTIAMILFTASAMLSIVDIIVRCIPYSGIDFPVIAAIKFFSDIIKILIPLTFIFIALLTRAKRLSTGYYYWNIAYGIISLVGAIVLIERSELVIQLINNAVGLFIIYWVTDKAFDQKRIDENLPKKRFSITSIIALIVFSASALIILAIGLKSLIENFHLGLNISILYNTERIITALLVIILVAAVVIKKRVLAAVYFVSFGAVSFIFDIIMFVEKFNAANSRANTISIIGAISNVLFSVFMSVFVLWLIYTPKREKKKKTVPPVPQPVTYVPVRPVYQVQQPIYRPVSQYPPQPPVYQPPIGQQVPRGVPVYYHQPIQQVKIQPVQRQSQGTQVPNVQTVQPQAYQQTPTEPYQPPNNSQ